MEADTSNESTHATRNTLIVFAVIAVALIAGSALIFLSRPEPVEIVVNPPVPTPTPAPTDTPSPVTVYITGEVADPQTTHTLPFGSRVQDVVDLAGGFTDDADLDRVNIAGLVRDGDQIDVPSLADDTDSTDSETALPTPSGGEVIFINTATLEELQTLPGIGASTAQTIIDYRTENGNFANLEDLDNVPGIGPATLETLDPLISFE